MKLLDLFLESEKEAIVYNLDLIERESGEEENISKEDNDFSRSKVKEIVYRTGPVILNRASGGIWFADSKEGVEKFAKSMKKEDRVGKGYYISLQNPYFIKRGFWYGYIPKVSSGFYGTYSDSRENYMNELISKGHDGIIINDDWWNDTVDENAVYGKQFIVFDEKQVKPA